MHSFCWLFDFSCGFKHIQGEAVEKRRSCSNDVAKKQDNNAYKWGNGADAFESGVAPSSPIPLPGIPRSGSIEREVYYM